MEVLILQIFVSLVLVGGSLLLFSHSMRQRDHEHADRLALLALERDDAARAGATPDAAPHQEARHE